MFYKVTDTELTSIADAIRAYGGTSASLSYPDGFVEAIQYVPPPNLTLQEKYIANTLSGSIYDSQVTEIRDYAFYELNLPTYINFPNCTSIGNSAFHNATGLKSFQFTLNTSRIGSYAFANTGISELSIACSNIGQDAFRQCADLKTVYIESIDTVPQSCFENCTSLEDVYFPDCTVVGINAFRSCSALKNISVSNCLTISMQAFQNCISLTSVSFSKCATLNNSVFSGCNNLKSISFPVCTTIGSYAFQQTAIEDVNLPSCTTIGTSAFVSCKQLKNVNAPVCTSIGSWAFAACDTLSTINLSMCSEIGSYCFANCYSLQSAYLPSCTYVYSWAFGACSALSYISLGEGVTIDKYAFRACRALVSLYLPGSSVAHASYLSDAFYNTPFSKGNGNIFVPESMLTAYTSDANWASFAACFVGVSDL